MKFHEVECSTNQQIVAECTSFEPPDPALMRFIVGVVVQNCFSLNLPELEAGKQTLKENKQIYKYMCVQCITSTYLRCDDSYVTLFLVVFCFFRVPTQTHCWPLNCT